MKTRRNIYQQTIIFPALYYNLISDITVLFDTVDTGTIVDVGTFGTELGKYDKMTPATDVSVWKRLAPGDSVELIQE